MAKASIDFAKQLPSAVDGWKKSTEVLVFKKDDLFKYINGGAELYRSYDFEQVTALLYLKDDDEIKVDIFDMGHAYNAFGVFSHGRETLSQELGQGSEYAAGFLSFFKDRYYVSLLAYPETEDKKQTLYKIARLITALIPAAGPLPPILKLLPQKGLVLQSVRYFRHYVWLNSHYYVADENILNIEKESQAVLAKYGDGSGKYFLLLVQYPDAARATAAHQKFRKHYLPEAKQPTMKLEDGRITGSQRKGSLVVVVFNAPQEKLALELLERIRL